MTNKNNKSIILYVVLVIALLIGMTFMLSQFQTGQTQTTTYSEVVGYFQDNKVSEFSLDLGSGQLNYKLKGETGKDGKEKVNTYKVPHVGLFVEAVEPIVLEYNKDNPDDRIEFVYKEAKDYSFLMSLIPIVLLIGAMVFFWFYMMKQTNGRRQNFSVWKSAAEKHGTAGKENDICRGCRRGRGKRRTG